MGVANAFRPRAVVRLQNRAAALTLGTSHKLSHGYEYSPASAWARLGSSSLRVEVNARIFVCKFFLVVLPSVTAAHTTRKPPQTRTDFYQQDIREFLYAITYASRCKQGPRSHLIIADTSLIRDRSDATSRGRSEFRNRATQDEY